MPIQHIDSSTPKQSPVFFGHQDQTVKLRSGIEIILGDFCLVEQSTFHFYSSENVCEFVFVLSGQFKNSLDGLATDIDITPLFSALWLTPPMAGYHDCPAHSPIRFVCIRICRELLIEIIAESLCQLPDDFLLTLQNKQNRLYSRYATMTIPMQIAAQQIFQCPYIGTMKKLFFESKALELISHFMVFHFGERVAGYTPLRSDDRTKIENARDILLAHLGAPLSLGVLAKAAGLSETKLTRGFRHVYNCSVFEYLRAQRLEKARMLLEAGEMTITEVAYTAGFSSSSHFSRSFTQHFGINPRIYRQQYS